MQPTLPAHKEVILVDILSHRLCSRKFQVNDVVIFVAQGRPHNCYCKRVVGVEGDVIVYFQLRPKRIMSAKVQPGHVWISGDNYKYSEDSRSFGQVPVGQLEGRAVVKTGLYPPHICRIDHSVSYDAFILRTEGQVTNYGKCYNITRDANALIQSEKENILLALAQDHGICAEHNHYIVDRLSGS